jgi:hypothetical protein
LRIALPIVLATALTVAACGGGGGDNAGVTVTETVAAASVDKPTKETAQAIYDWMQSRATTERWMRTLDGARVETDTALIFFNPFKGVSFEDINSLPDVALCEAVLEQQFPGIEHVKIIVVEEGVRTECP